MANGNVTGFAGTIVVNNLNPGDYNFDICKIVPTNVASPPAADILATITVHLPGPPPPDFTGTIIFTVLPGEANATLHVQNANTGAYTTIANATEMWTTFNTAVVRNDAISLYLRENVSNNALYEVFISPSA